MPPCRARREADRRGGLAELSLLLLIIGIAMTTIISISNIVTTIISINIITAIMSPARRRDAFRKPVSNDGEGEVGPQAANKQRKQQIKK